jgi:hypothetical protein
MKNTSRGFGFLVLLILYIIAALAGVFTFRLLAAWGFYLRLFAADIAATLFVWVVGLVLRNASVYDPYWSVAPIVMVLLGEAVLGVMNTGLILVTAVVIVWGVRLTAAAIGLALGTWILESPTPLVPSPAATQVWAIGLLSIALGAAETIEATAARELSLYGLGVLNVLFGLVMVFDPLPRIEPGMLLGISSLAVGAAAVSVALAARWPRQRLLPGPLEGSDGAREGPAPR